MPTHANSSSLGFEIPRETVERLKASYQHAREQEQFYDELASDIDRKLTAIRQLAPHLFEEQSVARPLNLDEPLGTSKTLIDAVVKAVDKSPSVLSPKGIREAVHAQGDGDLITNENYLYTAIKRAADQGRIDRTNGGYCAAL